MGQRARAAAAAFEGRTRMDADALAASVVHGFRCQDLGAGQAVTALFEIVPRVARGFQKATVGHHGRTGEIPNLG